MDITIEKSCVKFIDILLDLYWPVPSEVRTEMRNFQTTLLVGKLSLVKEYIESLQEKLSLKNKGKAEMLAYNQNKQNFQILANTVKINEPEVNWEKVKLETKRSKTVINDREERSQNNKIDSVSPDFHRKSSKTLLKIIRKPKEKHKGKQFENKTNQLISAFEKNDLELQQIMGSDFNI